MEAGDNIQRWTRASIHFLRFGPLLSLHPRLLPSSKFSRVELCGLEANGRLGVHGPGSDIDTICVCPRHIYREHFFGEFKQMLRDWPAVTEISVRSDTAPKWK